MSYAVHADAWLTEVMRQPVFRVEGVGTTNDLANHMAGQQRAFYFAKVSTEFPDEVEALTRLGFGVVDTNVTFQLVREPEQASAIEVGDIRSGDEISVLDIAGSAFRYSRFHLDVRIGQQVANYVKREWIRNYVQRKRGDILLVAREAGRVVGFVAPIVADGTAVIDLIAVATDAHSKGVGSALVAAFAKRYAGMPRVVGTQIVNVPSIRLYTKLGFALVRSQYVLHHHANR